MELSNLIKETSNNWLFDFMIYYLYFIFFYEIDYFDLFNKDKDFYFLLSRTIKFSNHYKESTLISSLINDSIANDSSISIFIKNKFLNFNMNTFFFNCSFSTTSYVDGVSLGIEPTYANSSFEIGKAYLFSYTLNNNTDEDKDILISFQIFPIERSEYFKKIHCFCYENILIIRNSNIELPVLAFIDKDILNVDLSNFKGFNIQYQVYEASIPLNSFLGKSSLN